MIPKESISRAIFCAVDQLNQQLPASQKIAQSLETNLFTPSTTLDSLGFITLLVQIEQQIEQQFNFPLNLTDEALMQQTNPFQTIGTLVDHISKIMEGKIDGRV